MLHSFKLLILTKSSKNQVVHKQKFKDVLSSTSQISVRRRVLDLEWWAVSIPTWVIFCFKFYNPDLHNIAISDIIGFTTKNPIAMKNLQG